MIRSFALALFVALLGVVLSVGEVRAQAAPVLVPMPTDPAARLPLSLSRSIGATLQRRGFAANDPRYVQTIRSVSRFAAQESAAATGLRWAKFLGTRATFIGAAVTVGGVVISWNQDATSVIVSPQQNPTYFPGFNTQELVWHVSSDSTAYAGDQTGVALKYFKEHYTYITTEKIEWLPREDITGFPSHPYRYPVRITGKKADGVTLGSVILYIYPWLADIACGTGFYMDRSVSPPVCRSYAIPTSFYDPQPITYPDLDTAIDNDPIVNLPVSTPIAPGLISEPVNRIWRDATAMPDYEGIPFDPQRPVTPEDVPTDLPTLPGLREPVPTTNPLPDPYTYPDNYVEPEDPNAMKIDWGPAPDVGPPTLEDTPTDLMKPLVDALAPFRSLVLTLPPESCPEWHSSVTVGFKVFPIDVTEHCIWLDQYFTLIQGIFLLGWGLAAFWTVMEA